MKFVKYKDVKEEIPTKKGIKGLTIKWLITDKDGAKNFAMRLFEVEPGGNTPWHQHDWEHEIIVLEGGMDREGRERRTQVRSGRRVLRGADGVAPVREYRERRIEDPMSNTV
jgi:quercetin dioxygenase-like cupin family protein